MIQAWKRPIECKRPECKRKFIGRDTQQFCSIYCANRYMNGLKRGKPRTKKVEEKCYL